MPGRKDALVQVLASDGLHTSVATSGVFQVDRHAPQATIVNDHQQGLSAVMPAAANQSESVVLHGGAMMPKMAP
jgi:hypothetical protein